MDAIQYTRADNVEFADALSVVEKETNRSEAVDLHEQKAEGNLRTYTGIDRLVGTCLTV